MKIIFLFLISKSLFLNFRKTMSMSGSLMGYENNNEVNQAKCKKPLKQLPVVTNVNASGVTTAGKTRRSSRATQRRGFCPRLHVNSLWSVWYGVIAVALQAYIATRCAKRFVGELNTFFPHLNIFFIPEFIS